MDRNLEAGRGAKPVFIDPERSITYAELHGETCRAANLLTSLDIRREQRIALVLLDTCDFPIVFLGAIRAGIVPVAINTLLTTEHYAYMLRDSRATALVVSAALLPVILPALEGLPDLRHIIVSGGAAPEGMIALTPALATQSNQFTTAATSADEPAFWLYSSGSTGHPKGTKHVHSSPMATARLYGQQVLGIREDDLVYSAAKFFFAYGLGNSLFFPMSVGATACLFPGRPTPEAVFAMMEKHQPSLFCGVPTLFAGMLHDDATQNHPGSSRLRLCTSAGEALPEHLGNAWQNRFGVEIIDGLGSTEMLHIFLSNRPGDVHYGTSGRAVPGYELKLIDETGAEVADDEIGELYVCGPTAAEGYWNQRDKSRSTFQGEWTRTGDKYQRDARGLYTYCGRADDMFKVSGIWVSPFEVEAALVSHEAVLEAAIVAAADDEGLLKPKAYIVLKHGTGREGLEADLKDHVKQRVGAWKYPRWITFIDALPKTATGKIQRFKLRDGG